MIKVYCHSNLDLYRERWPTELPWMPNVGDYIESMTTHSGYQLELQVVSITWKYTCGEYVPNIELHMTKWQHNLIPSKKEAAIGSITAFYEWYAPLVGKSVGAFI